jgi:23S rRNA (cytidine2498-2'-O)-methyltransferase
MAAASKASSDPGGQPAFVFAVCQAGAEPALKAEVAAAHPALRFAYSRPGLVTWKHAGGAPPPGFRLGAVFARVDGRALGAAADAAAVVEHAARVPGARLRLHVFPRDAWRPDEAPPDALAAQEAAVRALEAAVRAAAPERFHPEPTAAPGDAVLDVVVPPAAGEPAWVGWHVHEPGRSPHPGGRYPVAVPPEAPSRAYAKLEEALAWSGLAPRAGEIAVEIGSAPGGATSALLARGLEVWGVDPGAMDPRVLAVPRFHHLQTTLGDLRLEALPERVDWLLMDVNLAPQVALHGVRRIVAARRRTLRALIFTLKLNDWRMAAEVPALMRRVEGMGARDVRATQLPANRQEVCVVGMLERS